MRLKRVSVLCLVALVAMATTACPLPPPACGKSQQDPGGIIPDMRLQAAVGKALRKLGGSLSPTDLQSLTSLKDDRMYPRGRWCVFSLSGLEYAVNLTDLELRWHAIGDLTPLSSLAKLTKVDLSHNRIADISPLVRNPGLGEGDTIDLSYNRLHISKGTADFENISTLRGRGVAVYVRFQEP